jgi:hypothetical protein
MVVSGNARIRPCSSLLLVSERMNLTVDLTFRLLDVYPTGSRLQYSCHVGHVIKSGKHIVWVLYQIEYSRRWLKGFLLYPISVAEALLCCEFLRK